MKSIIFLTILKARFLREAGVEDGKILGDRMFILSQKVKKSQPHHTGIIRGNLDVSNYGHQVLLHESIMTCNDHAMCGVI